MEADSWAEYRRLILQALERLDGEIAKLNAKIDACRDEEIAALRVKVAMLEVKSGIWGAIMGLIAGALVAVAAYLK